MTELELFLTALCAALAVTVLLQALRRRQLREPGPAGEVSRAARNADSPEWSWTINAERTFTAISGRTRQLIGYEPAELIGRPIHLVMEPGELARAVTMVTALEGADKEISNLIISARHRDGRPVWFEVSVRMEPATDHAGICWSGHSKPLQQDAVQGGPPGSCATASAPPSQIGCW
ncbi:MAG: PAS domain-containing protein [Nakamurella sp.]